MRELKLDKIGLLTSYGSFSGQSNEQKIVNFLAGPDNSGNIIYLATILKNFSNLYSLSEQELTSEPNAIKQKYKFILCPFSNMLSQYFTSPIADICSSHNIPIVLFSIGLQAPFNTQLENIRLSKDCLNLLKQAKRTGCQISVRGEFSHNLLSMNGFDSIIIGCPSAILFDENKICQSLSGNYRIVGNATFSGLHKNLTSQMIDFLIDRCSGYVLQDEARIIRDVYSIELESIPLKEYLNTPYEGALKNKLFDYGFYNTGKYSWGIVRDFFRKNSFFSLDYNEWCSHLTTFDLSVGTRFHGNVASLHAGKPSIIVPCDLRTQELVSYHSLPSVPHPSYLYDLDKHSISQSLSEFKNKKPLCYDQLLSYCNNLGLQYR